MQSVYSTTPADWATKIAEITGTIKDFELVSSATSKSLMQSPLTLRTMNYLYLYGISQWKVVSLDSTLNTSEEGSQINGWNTVLKGQRRRRTESAKIKLITSTHLHNSHTKSLKSTHVYTPQGEKHTQTHAYIYIYIYRSSTEYQGIWVFC